MANYYTQFSAALKLESKAEKSWCEKELKKLRKKEDKMDPETAESSFQSEMPDDNHLWFHEDESGDPEHVGKFVQRFLKKFHPNNFWCMEYANICDKARLDGFSGGALFVTADEIKYMNASQWLEEQTLEFAGSSSMECQNYE